MRDLILSIGVLGTIPITLIRPHVGILVWCWISYMNPHRLSWGFVHEFRFALIIGVATIVGWVFSRDGKRLPVNMVVVLLCLLALWITVTSYFAHLPDAAYPKWDKSIKVFIMTVFSILLINNVVRLHALIWAIVVCIGYFGVKGGLWAIATGGTNRVWGPPDTFIADNNALALALVMILPLMRYLQLHSATKVVRWGLVVSMGLCGISIITSYSRGAFLATAVMLATMILKSRQRLLMIAAGMLALIAVGFYAPEKWVERINTIQTYQEDGSAMSRLQAWTFAWRLALDRPFFGGGFGVIEDVNLYKSYVPDIHLAQNFHSIYFEVLGYHGFVGLGVFLSLGFATYLAAGRITRQTKSAVDVQWAHDLAKMVQVSLVGFAVGGAFQNLAFFDLPYHLVAFIVITSMILQGATAGVEAPSRRYATVRRTQRPANEHTAAR